MFSRRQWLVRCARAAAGLTVLPWAGSCEPDPGAEDGGAPPVHAPDPEVEAPASPEEPDAGPVDPLPPGFGHATFEISPSSAIAWFLSPEPAEARIDLYDPKTRRHRFIGPVTLGVGAESTAAIVLDGLQPGHAYRYRVCYDGRFCSPWMSFRTAPPPDLEVPLRFAFSADVGPNEALYDVFPVLAGVAPEFFVSLGDWPYVDKAPAAVTADEIREKHRVARVHPIVQDFLRTVPVFATWDDHEVRDNWDGALARSNRDLVAAAVAVWDRFFPTGGGPRYRRIRWGALAELFILDTRLYRSANAAVDDERKTMLGRVQKAWLLAGLRDSDAALKIVVSSVPLDATGSLDSWEAFTTERQELLDLIDREPIGPVVVLTADRHYLEVRHHIRNLREYQVGPLAAGLGRMPEPRPAIAVVRARTRNFGEIVIQPGAPASATFVARDAAGAVLYAETLRLSSRRTP